MRRLSLSRHWRRSCTERLRRCRSLSPLPPLGFFPTPHTFCTRPKARSQKTANLCRATDEVARALAAAPSCADARDRPCRRLRAAPLPPGQSPRNVRATLHSCSFEPYARATLNLRKGLNQADILNGMFRIIWVLL